MHGGECCQTLASRSNLAIRCDPIACSIALLLGGGAGGRVSGSEDEREPGGKPASIDRFLDVPFRPGTNGSQGSDFSGCRRLGYQATAPDDAPGTLASRPPTPGARVWAQQYRPESATGSVTFAGSRPHGVVHRRLGGRPAKRGWRSQRSRHPTRSLRESASAVPLPREWRPACTPLGALTSRRKRPEPDG